MIKINLLRKKKKRNPITVSRLQISYCTKKIAAINEKIIKTQGEQIQALKDLLRFHNVNLN